MSPCHPQEELRFAKRLRSRRTLPDFPALLNWGADVLLRKKAYLALLAALRVHQDDNFWSSNNIDENGLAEYVGAIFWRWKNRIAFRQGKE
jgi:hypothetical protein